jgi:hypothetical protein
MTKEELADNLQYIMGDAKINIQVKNSGPKAGVSIYPIKEAILKDGRIILVAQQK